MDGHHQIKHGARTSEEHSLEQSDRAERRQSTRPEVSHASRMAQASRQASRVVVMHGQGRGL